MHNDKLTIDDVLLRLDSLTRDRIIDTPSSDDTEKFRTDLLRCGWMPTERRCDGDH
jgi:hypothetical protein